MQANASVFIFFKQSFSPKKSRYPVTKILLCKVLRMAGKLQSSLMSITSKSLYWYSLKVRTVTQVELILQRFTLEEFSGKPKEWESCQPLLWRSSRWKSLNWVEYYKEGAGRWILQTEHLHVRQSLEYKLEIAEETFSELHMISGCLSKCSSVANLGFEPSTTAVEVYIIFLGSRSSTPQAILQGLFMDNG